MGNRRRASLPFPMLTFVSVLPGQSPFVYLTYQAFLARTDFRSFCNKFSNSLSKRTVNLLLVLLRVFIVYVGLMVINILFLNGHFCDLEAFVSHFLVILVC